MKPSPDKTKTLALESSPGKSQDRLMAEVGQSGVLLNAATVVSFGKGTLGDLSLTESVSVLKEKVDTVRGGDLGEAETMLMAQAVALNSVFAELARRSALNMGEYLNASETYMRLALKAQSQCRATLETLAAIKNPPVVFAKQANIAHGPQQVNNGTPAPPGSAHKGSRAGKPENEQTKLLGKDDGKRLDTGAPGKAGRTDPAMATMGKGHRPKKRRG